MTHKSTVLRNAPSDNKLGKSHRRRGSLPSPPLDAYSIHHVRKDSGTFEEETIIRPEDKDDIADRNDFADAEEDELLVLFERGDVNDDNEESEEEESSWSISPILEDIEAITKEKSDKKGNSISSAKCLPHPPVPEEVNGKIQVTEKFMRDLIR